VVGFLLLSRHVGVQVEIAYWDSIKASRDAARFEQYLEEYPQGRFAALARAEIGALKKPSAPPVVSPPTPEPKTIPEPQAPAPPLKPTVSAAQTPGAPAAGLPPTPEPKTSPAPQAPALPPKPAASAAKTPSAPSAPPVADEGKVNPADGQRYVWIPPGTYLMGCSPGDNECLDSERPAHTVTISSGFWMGRTELTVGAYKRFVSGGGAAMPFGNDSDEQPVINVLWNDAVACCRWAGGRLPTEAEWEYAARAGTAGARYGNLDSVAWYNGNSGGRVHPVGQKEPNAFRLFDMLGNVYEWVADRYGDKYYGASEPRDPQGPPGRGGRVLRGGSWYFVPKFSRVSFRSGVQPGGKGAALGFRCVREVIP
jgi:formylglycine-generating enzyme required for sulfatase activity